MKKTYTLLTLLLCFSLAALAQDESLDESFSNPTELTDKQMDDANNFVHQGVKDRVIKEGCKNINDCKDDDDGFPLEMVIGKAYALLGMMTGGGGMVPTLTAPDKKLPEGATPAPEAAEGAKAEKETKPDYCMMVAMGYETLGSIIQQQLQKKAENKAAGVGDAQLQALISLKETHKARAKTASFQRTIYAGVSACYAAYLVTGGAIADTKFILKMGGAAALTVLYQRKVNKHKSAADKVQKVIAALPTAGAGCDPWTKTSCFCSEITSKAVYPAEYEEVCVLNNGNFDTPKVALGCAAVNGSTMSYDKECKCKQTNSCLKSNLNSNFPNMAFGSNLMNEANKTFDLLNSGDFDQGKIDQASLNTSALAARVKVKSSAKIPKPKLTDDQKKMAGALKNYMPEALANVAAASNSSYTGGINDSALGASALSKLPPSVKEKVADAIKVNYKKGSGGNSFASDEPAFQMPKFPGQGGPTKSSTEVLTFAEQAISQADVSNAPQTPIFDIISNRYRRSGWKKLETAEK